MHFKTICLRECQSFTVFSFLAGSAYRECMDNGTWALKSNYSNCEPILEEKVGDCRRERILQFFRKTLIIVRKIAIGCNNEKEPNRTVCPFMVRLNPPTLKHVLFEQYCLCLCKQSRRTNCRSDALYVASFGLITSYCGSDSVSCSIFLDNFKPRLKYVNDICFL